MSFGKGSISTKEERRSKFCLGIERDKMIDSRSTKMEEEEEDKFPLPTINTQVHSPG